MCQCKENYKKSLENPRICEEKTCPLEPSNAAAHTAEPYSIGTVVIVICTQGYHTEGTEETEQVLTCSEEGFFTPLVKDCIGE